MYFLINNADQSYNCSSTEPFPAFMLNEGVTEVFSENSTGIEDITTAFYDATTDTFTLKEDVVLMTEGEVEDLKAMGLEQMSLDKELEEAARFDNLLDKLSTLLTPEQLSALKDTEEVTAIEDMLNATN